jgi:predicted dehydrogenase
MPKINFALLGGGRIMPRIVKGFKLSKNANLYAFGSRDPKQAQGHAEQYEVENWGSYEQLLADPKVQAVYIATYNPGHYELIEKALKAGKHVMCEKPMVPTQQQLNELFELAKSRHLMLMSAHKGIFLPLTQKIKKMMDEGVFGDIVYLQASYSYDGGFPKGHWVYDPATGGGMMDVGVYPISVLNFLADSPIVSCHREVRMYQGVDGFTLLAMRYGNGVIAQAQCGLMLQMHNALNIVGTKGYLEDVNFWKSGHADYWLGEEHYELNEPMESEFYYEIDHFASCVQQQLTESPVLSQKALQQILLAVGKDGGTVE